MGVYDIELRFSGKETRPPRSLSDFEMGSTACDFACSSACLRVIRVFQVPKRTLEHELLRA